MMFPSGWTLNLVIVAADGLYASSIEPPLGVVDTIFGTCSYPEYLSLHAVDNAMVFYQPGYEEPEVEATARLH